MARPSNELLRKVPLFEAFEDAELDRLAGEFFERSYRAGETLAGAGDSGRSFFVIEDGQVSVAVHGTVVGTLGPGSNFGEIALIDRQTRSATITAETDVHAFILPIWSFRPIVEQDPQMMWKLLESVAGRIRTIQERQLAGSGQA
jgi:CRP-like cAMP-binding protein